MFCAGKQALCLACDNKMCSQRPMGGGSAYLRACMTMNEVGEKEERGRLEEDEPEKT